MNTKELLELYRTKAGYSEEAARQALYDKGYQDGKASLAAPAHVAAPVPAHVAPPPVAQVVTTPVPPHLA